MSSRLECARSERCVFASFLRGWEAQIQLLRERWLAIGFGFSMTSKADGTLVAAEAFVSTIIFQRTLYFMIGKKSLVFLSQLKCQL